MAPGRDGPLSIRARRRATRSATPTSMSGGTVALSGGRAPGACTLARLDQPAEQSTSLCGPASVANREDGGIVFGPRRHVEPTIVNGRPTPSSDAIVASTPAPTEIAARRAPASARCAAVSSGRKYSRRTPKV